jgi:hypothetical protein
MEIILNEEVKTVVKLMVSKFSKDYMEKIGIVEVIKCLVNVDTGEIIKREFIQNRIFRNRIIQEQTTGEEGQTQFVNKEQNDFGLLIKNIAEMGEESYMEKLLGIIVQELATKQ